MRGIVGGKPSPRPENHTRPKTPPTIWLRAPSLVGMVEQRVPSGPYAGFSVILLRFDATTVPYDALGPE
jgi:hypothetical protein